MENALIKLTNDERDIRKRIHLNSTSIELRERVYGRPLGRMAWGGVIRSDIVACKSSLGVGSGYLCQAHIKKYNQVKSKLTH